MTDIATISTALTSSKTATEIASFLKCSTLSLERAEAKMKVAELISTLAEVKVQLAEVQQNQIEKDLIIANFKKQLELRDMLVYEEPFYFMQKGTGNDGPFCQQCYDNSNKLIRLQKTSSEGYWRCKTCENGFENEYSRLSPGIFMS